MLAAAAVLTLALPAYAIADEPLQATGSITYTWQGSPSRGCAAIGVCGVQGALIVEAQGFAFLQQIGHQSIINFGSSATVRVLTGTGQSAGECVDTPLNQGGELSVFTRRSGGRVVGSFEPSLSSGRCAGPMASDLRALSLPVRSSGGKHPTLDLRTRRDFTAGPYAGTLVSTVTMRPAPGSGSSSSSSSGSFGGPPTGRRKVLVEHVSLRYRVTGSPEPLVVSFSGESDPFCTVLDSCGASGDVALSAPAFSGTLTLRGSREVSRRGDARQVIADVKRGRISLFGTASSRLLTSETFVRPDGSRCQDSATNGGVLVVGGFPPGGSVSIALSVIGSDVDALRTHCAGPSFSDAFVSNGQSLLARGPLDYARLLLPHSTVTMTDSGGFSGLGYTGSRSGAIGLSLSLERVRTAIREESR